MGGKNMVVALVGIACVLAWVGLVALAWAERPARRRLPDTPHYRLVETLAETGLYSRCDCECARRWLSVMHRGHCWHWCYLVDALDDLAADCGRKAADPELPEFNWPLAAAVMDLARLSERGLKGYEKQAKTAKEDA